MKTSEYVMLIIVNILCIQIATWEMERKLEELRREMKRVRGELKK